MRPISAGHGAALIERSARYRAATWCVVALLVLVPCSAVLAQTAELRAGARVRLRAPSAVAGRVEGVVLSRQGDTLMFAPKTGVTRAIAVASITEAEVFRGKSGRAGIAKGALWGGGVGLVIGAGSAGFSDCAPNETCTGGSRAAGVVAVTAFGAIIGGLVGLGRGGEQWERLILP